MMKNDIRKRLITALESGKYQKGTRELRDEDNRFCVLGVLTDLYARETSNPWQHCSSGHYFFDGNSGTLPARVLVWAELDFDFIHQLIDLNDDTSGDNYRLTIDLLKQELVTEKLPVMEEELVEMY